MAQEQNVTYRTRKFRRAGSLNELSSTDSSLLDTTMMSLPNTSLDENQEIVELNEKINLLTNQLASAHLEIENLNAENFRLKTDLDKSLKVVETYKKIGIDNTCVTPLSERNKKRCKNKKTPKIVMTDIQQNKNDKAPEESNDDNISLSNLPHNFVSQTEERNNIQVIKNSNVNFVPISRVVVIADDQGRNIQRTLQQLMGERFQVTSFWKSGATLQDIIEAEHTVISSLTMNDYLIVLGGTNDRSPCIFKTCVSYFLCSTRNTNVFFCEIPFNKYLSESKLNYELEFICSKFMNAKYIDMGFAHWQPYRKFFSRHVSQLIHKDILNINYIRKYGEYIKNKRQIDVFLTDKTTQTDDNIVENIVTTKSHEKTTNSTTGHPSFFRV